MSRADMLIAKYYRDVHGRMPVKDYIDALPLEARRKVHEHIERLNAFGETLDYPHTSQVDGELRELRCWFGRRHLRILYRRSERFAVLLHMVDKRARLLPAPDTEAAHARWRDFKQRMDASIRIPPRALGQDAP
jgi:phage-related protein